jgi:hypothetical protein
VAERTWDCPATIQAVRRELSAGCPLLYRTHAALIQAALAIRVELAGVQPIVGGDTARLSP